MAFNGNDDLGFFFESLCDQISFALSQIRQFRGVELEGDIGKDDLFYLDYLGDLSDHSLLDRDLFHNDPLRDRLMRLNPPWRN